MTLAEVKLLSGIGTEKLAKKISEHYGENLADVNTHRFSDGEFTTVINESVRGKFVFIIQSTNPPTENFMEMLMMVDAARRASADYITCVIPYFGFARQDRKDKPRVAIGAKLMANLIVASGADRVMTMDLHAGQIQGFFDIPVDHLNATAIFMPYLETLGIEDLLFASPDVGSTKRTRLYAQHFNTDFVICDKHRKKANEIAEMNLIGDVEGKNVILVDDLIDTAGTMCLAAEKIMEKGAKSVRAICTHAVLSGPAYERLEASAISELIVTDTIPLQKKSSKIKVLTVSKLFAKAIRNTHEHKSINSLFITQSV
ncbi:MAG: ribose-phosphate pyrophosphokinase [Planctomycetota bacterium]|jgi:ribose-phosphate pyrophosphokinase